MAISCICPSRPRSRTRAVLDHIAGHGTVRLDIDADAGVVVRHVPIGRFGNRLRMMLPATADAAAPVEIADGDATAAPSTVLLAITAPWKENSK
jgi:hypothetical protein